MTPPEHGPRLPNVDVGPRLPSIKQILELADAFGLDLSIDEAAQYRELMRVPFKAYRRIEELQ